MRILTSYLIRAHVGPFVFALSTLTGLLFLNAVAQRLENLAGKGLTWDVILEFLYLSLPHTVALTLPMAVLVAVLYAFSELTANNEVTAMKAGGVRPQRVMVPLLGIGVIIGGVMLLFNDRVLPAANHRLKNLLVDINRKSPTFVLREQVVNQVRAGEAGNVYYLTAATIDNQTNELEGVAIYDTSDPRNRRTTYAERGRMEFNEARTDLYLTLFDGVTFETRNEREESFEQRRFERQILPLRGVGNELERRTGATERTDREMSIAMLDSAATERSQRLDSIRTANLERNRSWIRQALGLEEVTAEPEDRRTRSEAVPPGGALRPPREAPQGAAANRSEAGTGPGESPRPGAPDPASRDRTPGAQASSGGAQGSDGPEVSALSRDPLTRLATNQTNTGWAVENALESRIHRYEVEIHKKYTLAFACVVFVLLGGPLAMRFPRGGLGLVIAASSGIFAIYWAGLIGGESLADRGVAPPAVTMWIPNIVFTGLGLWLFATMGREGSTSRGGGWDDVFWSARRAVTAPFGRRRGPSARAVPTTEGGG